MSNPQIRRVKLTNGRSLLMEFTADTVTISLYHNEQCFKTKTLNRQEAQEFIEKLETLLASDEDEWEIPL